MRGPLALAIVLLLATFAYAKPDATGRKKLQKGGKPTASDLCARQLQAILYRPENSAYNYLNFITAEFRDIAQDVINAFLIGDYGPIREFLVKYSLTVVVTPAYGSAIVITPTTISATSPAVTHGVAQTYVGLDGFDISTDLGLYYYTFFVQSSTTGTLLYFTFIMPMANTPIFYCAS